MKPTSFDLVVAGHLCLDMIPRFVTQREAATAAQLFRPGTLVLMGDMTFATGGAVSNVGIAMTVFGCRVGFMAKVGDDAVGGLIRQLVARYGSAEGIAVAPGQPSSYTVVLSPPGIDRIFLHCPGTNDTFTAADADAELIARARLLHFGYPTLMRSLYSDGGVGLAGILRRAKEAGVTTSLDISLPDPASPAGQADWQRIYEQALPFVDLFLPSVEESFFTLHPRRYLERRERHGDHELIDHVSAEEVAGFADEYLRMGCRVAAVKAGHNGWYVKTAGRQALAGLGRAAPQDPAAWADRELWCPAFLVPEVASSVGSGDCSIAAFLCGLLRGLPIEQSLRLANCAGALNLQAMDATSGLPPWEKLRAAAEAMTVRDCSPFLAPPWRWRAQSGCWEKAAAPPQRRPPTPGP